jgi:hypothetical protein
LHAIVIHADIHDRSAAKQGLEEGLLPALKGLPGFVGAYFVAVDDTHGLSIQVFETEEQSRAAAPPDGSSAPGVTLAAMQFGEVLGAA